MYADEWMRYLRHFEEHIVLEPKRCRVGAPRCSRPGGYGRSSYRCRQWHRGQRPGVSRYHRQRLGGQRPGVPRYHRQRHGGQRPGVPRYHRQRHGGQRPGVPRYHRQRLGGQRPGVPRYHRQRLGGQRPGVPRYHRQRLGGQRPGVPRYHRQRHGGQRPGVPHYHRQRHRGQRPGVPHYHRQRLGVQRPGVPRYHRQRLGVQRPGVLRYHRQRLGGQRPGVPRYHTQQIHPITRGWCCRINHTVKTNEKNEGLSHCSKGMMHWNLPSLAAVHSSTRVLYSYPRFAVSVQKTAVNEDMFVQWELCSTSVRLTSLTHWLPCIPTGSLPSPPPHAHNNQGANMDYPRGLSGLAYQSKCLCLPFKGSSCCVMFIDGSPYLLFIIHCSLSWSQCFFWINGGFTQQRLRGS